MRKGDSSVWKVVTWLFFPLKTSFFLLDRKKDEWRTSFFTLCEGRRTFACADRLERLLHKRELPISSCDSSRRSSLLRHTFFYSSRTVQERHIFLSCLTSHPSGRRRRWGDPAGVGSSATPTSKNTTTNKRRQETGGGVEKTQAKCCARGETAACIWSWRRTGLRRVSRDKKRENSGPLWPFLSLWRMHWAFTSAEEVPDVSRSYQNVHFTKRTLIFDFK